MATLAIVNPRRRRKARKHRKARRANPLFRKRRRKARRRNPVPLINSRKRRRARRHNPLSLRGLSGGGIVRRIKSTVMPAAYAVAGAVGLDLAWGYLPIPDTLKVGTTRYFAKGAGAVLLGWIAEKVVKKEHAHMIGVGAMTVVLYTAAREALANYAPSVNQALGDAGDDFSRLSYYGSGSVAGLGFGRYPGRHAGVGDGDELGVYDQSFVQGPAPYLDMDVDQSMSEYQ